MSAASFVPSSVKPFGMMNSSFMYAQLIQIGKRLLQLLMRSEISRLISIMWWQSFVLDFLIKLIPSFESCCILEAAWCHLFSGSCAQWRCGWYRDCEWYGHFYPVQAGRISLSSAARVHFEKYGAGRRSDMLPLTQVHRCCLCRQSVLRHIRRHSTWLNCPWSTPFDGTRVIERTFWSFQLVPEPPCRHHQWLRGDSQIHPVAVWGQLADLP